MFSRVVLDPSLRDSSSILIPKNLCFGLVSTPLFINSHKAYIITYFASKISDEFSKYSSSFKKEIAIIQGDICFSAKANARKILFAVEIPVVTKTRNDPQQPSNHWGRSHNKRNHPRKISKIELLNFFQKLKSILNSKHNDSQLPRILFIVR